MVLRDRIELSTSPLPMECSTTELPQHGRSGASAQATPGLCHRLWRVASHDEWKRFFGALGSLGEGVGAPCIPGLRARRWRPKAPSPHHGSRLSKPSGLPPAHRRPHEGRDPTPHTRSQARPRRGAQVRSARGRAAGGGLAGEPASAQAAGQGAAFRRGPRRGSRSGLSRHPHPEGAKAPSKGQFPALAPCFRRAARLIAAHAPDSSASPRTGTDKTSEDEWTGSGSSADNP